MRSLLSFPKEKMLSVLILEYNYTPSKGCLFPLPLNYNRNTFVHKVLKEPGPQYCLHDALITNKEVQEKYPYILEQSL